MSHKRSAFKSATLLSLIGYHSTLRAMSGSRVSIARQVRRWRSSPPLTQLLSSGRLERGTPQSREATVNDEEKRRVSVLVWVVRWWVCSDGESKAQGLGTRGRRSSKSCSPAQNAWGCVLLPLPYAACVLTEPPPLRRLRVTAVCRVSWEYAAPCL